MLKVQIFSKSFIESPTVKSFNIINSIGISVSHSVFMFFAMQSSPTNWLDKKKNPELLPKLCQKSDIVKMFSLSEIIAIPTAQITSQCESCTI